MNPLVTIITPTYNCEKFIKETVESVLRQDYDNIQYIVLDDGSTDNTAQILFPYLGKRNFNYCYHPNMGEQKTVNRGLDMVEGKYFMIVNSDDPLLPKAVSTLVDFMEAHPNLIAAYPDWNSVNEDGSFKAHVSNGDYDLSRMVRYHKVLPSVGTIVSRVAIELGVYRDSQFKYIGDFDYWMRVALHGEMARVPLALATWRSSSSQLSNQKGERMAREHVTLVNKFYALPNIPDDVIKVKREAYCWAYLVAAFLSMGKQRYAYMLDAIKVYPEELFKIDTYSALAKHAYYILRR